MERKRATIVIVVTGVTLMLGIFADMISVSNFFFKKTFADDYLPGKKDTSAYKSNYPDTLQEKQARLKTKDKIREENKVSDTSARVQDNLQDPSEVFKVESNLQTPEGNSEKYSKIKYQEISYTVFSDGENKPSSETVVRMSNPAPQAGYGRFALRLFCADCDYPNNYIEIRILMEDSSHVASGKIASRFDPSARKSTTFSKDLLPGKYLVELNFENLGKEYFPVDIIEGKLLLYEHTKVNPYGSGNAKIVFFSLSGIQKYKIILDGKDLGPVTLYPEKGMSLIVKSGNHTCWIEPAKLENSDWGRITKYISLINGENFLVYVER